MNYTLLFYLSPADFVRRDDPATRDKFYASFLPYMNALREAGVMVSGAGLEGPAAATTLRLLDGERTVQDGPYADTKEQLGGVIVIHVPNQDAALDWAARFPAGEGMVEVRPNVAPIS